MSDSDHAWWYVSYMLSGVLGLMWIGCCLIGPSTPVCHELVFDYDGLGIYDRQTCNVWLWYGLSPLGVPSLIWAHYCLKMMFRKPPTEGV